jgi:serine/threonine protein kinase
VSLKKLGRYELIRVLGKGAMGVVYEGRDPNLDRRVAIKTVKVENLSEEAAAEYEHRFRTEARSAARLQHPNIVSVYDSDRDGNIAFLVMEYIQGDDLKHYLDRGVRYSLEQSLKMIRDLLSALDYAHKQGIVHRDIKPANLLIEPGGRVKLTDFGVARIQDSGEATRTQGSMVGTLKYMSPEQVQGQKIDARADLFSVGVVLYQLLTDKRPFDGDNDFSIIHQIIGHSPPPPSSVNPKLPAAIDAVVARSLAKNRDERFATARDFAVALQAAIRRAEDQTVVPPADPSKRRDPAGTGSRGGGITAPGTAAGIQTSPTTPSSIGLVTQELELVYWKDVKDSTDPEELQGFLEKFPNGIYADLARRRVRKLMSGVTGDQTVLSNGGTDPDLEATRVRTEPSRPLTVPPVVPVPAAAEPASSASNSAPAGGAVATGEPDTTAPSTITLAGEFTRTVVEPRDETAPGTPADGEAPAASAAPASTVPPLVAPPPQESAPPASPAVVPAVAASAAAPITFAKPAVPDADADDLLPAAPPAARPAAGKPPWMMLGAIGIVAAIGTVALLTLLKGGDDKKLEAALPAASAPASAAVAGASESVPVAVSTVSTEVTSTAITTAAVPGSASAPGPATSASASAARPAVVASAPASQARRPASQPRAARVPPPLPDTRPVFTPAPPPASEPRVVETPRRAPSTPASTAAPSPVEECRDKIFLSKELCLAEHCDKPGARNHPLCVKRREDIRLREDSKIRQGPQ